MLGLRAKTLLLATGQGDADILMLDLPRACKRGERTKNAHAKCNATMWERRIKSVLGLSVLISSKGKGQGQLRGLEWFRKRCVLHLPSILRGCCAWIARVTNLILCEWGLGTFSCPPPYSRFAVVFFGTSLKCDPPFIFVGLPGLFARLAPSDSLDKANPSAAMQPKRMVCRQAEY